jgi:hypothetical protein
VTRRRQPEFKIHTAVCDHLRLRAKPGVVWLHVPNQRNGDARTGALLKRMGTLAGAADLLIWHRGHSFALEIKVPGGRPSEAQLEFMARFADAGGHTAIAEGIDKALAVLESWQILKVRASVGAIRHGEQRRASITPCASRRAYPIPSFAAGVAKLASTTDRWTTT